MTLSRSQLRPHQVLGSVALVFSGAGGSDGKSDRVWRGDSRREICSGLPKNSLHL